MAGIKKVKSGATIPAVGFGLGAAGGFGTAGATKTAYLQYGYRNTHGIGNHPFIIKATALPTTIYDGS